MKSLIKKSLIKSTVIIGQVLGLVMGDKFITASWEVPERYPNVARWFF